MSALLEHVNIVVMCKVWLKVQMHYKFCFLGADLYQLLAATRTCSLILLFLGLPESYELPRVQRPIRAILFAVSADAADNARRLRRRYLALQ